jgi:carboxylesterase
MITSGGQPYYLPGGPFGCLLIHSFTCCPKEIRWLGTQLNEAGFSVMAIRLFGHATRPKDLHRARFHDWIANVEDGLTLLKNQCDKCIVIGISLGGALALIAGGKLRVDGIVAIATPYALPIPSRIKSLKVLIQLIQLIGLGNRSMMKSPLSQDRDAILPVDRLSYDTFPPRALLEVKRLFAEMQRILPKISAPTLLIDGEVDPDNEMRSISQILEHISAKRTKIVKVRPGVSESARTQTQERIASAIIQFVASLSGSRL